MAPKRPPSRRGVLIGLVLLLAGGLAALGAWVIIKDRDGNIVGKSKIPDGGSVVVEPETPQSKPPVPAATHKPFAVIDVAADGKRFLMIGGDPAAHIATRVNYVLDWTSQLKN